MTTEENGFTLTRKVFEPVESQFTPGERSMVAWISTDAVDHERDVVVSSGIDYKTYFMGKTPETGNPCVLAFHDLGRWPLGRCEWVKIKQSEKWNGLYAKTIFDDDPETEAVWRKIKSRSLRGISIGFRPPDDLKPGEWGPPTREELLRRPDWKTAERVIRRCVLLEYSVCSLPMNPQALVAAVNKGVHRPVYSLPKVTKMDNDTPEIPDETEDKSPCDCGKSECKECSERMQAKAEEDDEDREHEAEAGESPEVAEAAAEPGEDGAEPEPAPAEDPDDFDEADESELPIKTGDFVDIKSKGHRGPGRVEKIHRRGAVDHVDEEVFGTKDDPAARVRCYKAHGDGHQPCERRVGVRLKELTKRTEPLKPPTKKAFAGSGKGAISQSEKNGPDPTPEPLPPLVAKSDQQLQRELEEQIKQIPQIVNDAIARYVGVV